ncbi:unnamed protein product [Trichobilharzia regenti]|nr:unnamed protein product [Trichobilharzia regenti]
MYIESTDFQEVADKGYRRLTPSQSVGLRYTGLVLEFTELRKNSLVIIPDALVEQSVKDAKVFSAYQFERIGFFSVDPDTNSERVSIILSNE